MKAHSQAIEKLREAHGDDEQEWIVIQDALNDVSSDYQGYWNYQAALNHLDRKKYETSLAFALAALDLQKHEKQRFKKCISEKKYQEMWLRTVDPTVIENKDGEPALKVILKLLTTDSGENPYFYPEAAHRFTSYMLSNEVSSSPLYPSTVVLDCLRVYFKTANQLQIEKEAVNLSFFGLFPLIFRRIDTELIDSAPKISVDKLELKTKEALSQLAAAIKLRFEDDTLICFSELFSMDFDEQEKSYAFKLLISDDREIQDIPWILDMMAFEEWKASNYGLAKKLYEKLIDKKKKDFPKTSHANLVYYQASAYEQLGWMHAAGEGVVKSKQTALAHYYMAKALDPKCIDKQELAELEKSCTPSQLEKAENYAAVLMEKFEADK